MFGYIKKSKVEKIINDRINELEKWRLKYDLTNKGKVGFAQRNLEGLLRDLKLKTNE